MTVTHTGNAIRPILGTPCGFYTLDLSKDMDRICLHRLMEISASANLFRIQDKANVYTKGCFGDTSMHNNFAFFRNEMFNGIHTVICPAKFIPLPSRGLLEFDFVGDFRPLITQHLNTMSDSKCTKILINLALLDISEKDDNLNLLQQMKDQSLPVPTGTADYDKYSTHLSKMKMKAAKESQDAQTLFYSKLSERKEYLRAKQKLQEIKVDYEHHSENRAGNSSSSSSQSNLLQVKYNKNNKNHRLQSKSSRQKLLSRTISKTMDDPFMKTEVSPNKEALKGIVEKTIESTTYEKTDDDDSLDQNMSLMSLEKVVCNLETESKSGTFLKGGTFASKSGSFPAKAAQQVLQKQQQQQQQQQQQRSKRRKTLKRMDSKFVAAVTKNRRRLRDLMASDGIHPGAKIKKVVASLVEAVGNYWIECRHVAIMLHFFPFKEEDEVHTFGSYKIELVVSEILTYSWSRVYEGLIVWRVYKFCLREKVVFIRNRSEIYSRFCMRNCQVMLFSRVVDVHNFDLIFSHLCPQEVGIVYCRLVRCCM